MRYASRIKQVEKKAGKGDGTVHIEVSRYGDNDNFDEQYAAHRARQVLGIRPADGWAQTIFVVGPETEAKYQDMTVKQAKAILRRAEKNLPKEL